MLSTEMALHQHPRSSTCLDLERGSGFVVLRQFIPTRSKGFKRKPTCSQSYRLRKIHHKLRMNETEASSSSGLIERQRLIRPVVISDVLDTLVVDPFFNGMSSFFKFESMKQFMEAKSPNVWVDFELGRIDEKQVGELFFKDGRLVDVNELKIFLRNSYKLVPGVDRLLNGLRRAKIDVHVCSNYPIWANLIEETVGLNSKYGVKWTFVSARHGVRKPDKRAFALTAQLAGVEMSSCILLDDREKNCLAAVDAGYMTAIRFKNARQVCHQLEAVLTQNHVPVQFDFNLEIND